MSLVPALEIGLWNAWLFMCVFILQMLAVMLLGKGTWERSSHPADIKKSRLEKSSPFMGNGVWGLATLYSIFLPFKLGTPWFYIGLAVFLVGLAILVIATADFAAPHPERPITQGIYSFSRHPMYLSMIIIYIGTAVASASWVFLLLGVANAFWVGIEARVEERYCLKHYGDAYRNYMKRTPRWLGIPRVEKANA
jgi:protein-S-isoprenylcysteine O-methyltransferase Ste14